jgi:hypothetical protein
MFENNFFHQKAPRSHWMDMEHSNLHLELSSSVNTKFNWLPYAYFFRNLYDENM